MSLHFHHFFVFVSKNAPVVDELTAKGFCEGSRNFHQGQGTANRRIFFQNGMLEFIWVEDPSELKDPATAQTHLFERSQYRESGYSPFGICLCESTQNDPTPKWPFAGWAYRPKYLAPGLSIWMAANEHLPWEPMIFLLRGVKPFEKGNTNNEPVDHSNGAERIEKITIGLGAPMAKLSAAGRMLQDVDGLALSPSRELGAEIRLTGLNHALIDLYPWCPVKIISDRPPTI